MSTIAEIVDCYKTHCSQLMCRTNSAVVSQLQLKSILTTIDLSTNFVGCKGFRPILEVLKKTPTIECLNVRGNRLDNDAVIELVEICKDHIGITTLDLSSNPISYLGGKALLELAEHNKRMIAINLEDTDVYDSLVKRIQQVIMANRVTQGMRESMTAAPTSEEEQNSPHVRVVLPKQESKVALLPHSTSMFKAAPTTALTKPTPRPPVPAVASDVVSRLTPAQRAQARENYRRRMERNQLSLQNSGGGGPIPGDASTVAKGLKEELHLLVKQQIAYEQEKTLKALEEASVLSDKALMSEDTNNDSHQTFTPSAAGDVGDDVSYNGSPTKTHRPNHNNNINTTEEASTSTNKVEIVNPEDEADNSSAPPAPAPPPRRKSSNAPSDMLKRIQEEHLGNITADQPIGPHPPRSYHMPEYEKDVDIAPYVAPVPIPRPEDLQENFRILFEEGSTSYKNHNMEGAYTAWSHALEIANESQNREWISVITNNLQRLSFDLLMAQANENLKDGLTDAAVSTFGMARDIALRARNAAWEAETEKGIRTAHHNAFQYQHDRASKILENLTQTYGPSNATLSVFEHEWSRMLKVKEALECWYVAVGSASQIKGSTGVMLAEIAATALDVVYNHQLQMLFVPEITCLPRHTYLGTHGFSTAQKREMVAMYLDVLSCVRKLKHRRWEALTRGYLGCLYHGTNEPAKIVLDNYLDMIEIGRDINDDVFQAVGHAFVAIHQTQLSRLAEAERSIVQSLNILGTIKQRVSGRELQGLNMTLKSGGGGGGGIDAGTVPFMASKEFLTYVEWLCHQTRQQVYVGQSRTTEALEAAEKCKSLLYSDLLAEKIRKNFSPNTTVQNMIQTASLLRGVVVHYSIVYRVEWDTVKDSPSFLEQLYVWGIPNEGGIKFWLLDVEKRIQEPSLLPLIQKLRTQLHVEPGVSGEDIQLTLPDGLWRNTLRMLHKALIAPIVDYLHSHTGYDEAGNGRVIIIPDGFLWFTPFSALLDDGDVYFVERFLITMIPSTIFASYCSINSAKAKERRGERRVVLTVSEDQAPCDISPFPFHGATLWNESQRLANVVAGEIINVSDMSKLAIRQTLSNSGFVHVSLPFCPGASQGATTGAFTLTGRHDYEDLLFVSDLEVCDVPAQVIGIAHGNIDCDDALRGQNALINAIRAWVCAGSASIIASQWSTPDVMCEDFF
eukprot:PhF_6_TR36484/c0_g1_i3/m.53601